MITPADYDVHTETITIPVKAGKGTLLFKGKGASDSYGATIVNVKIISNKGKSNEFSVPVKNGDFTQPNVGTSWKITTIPGWTGEAEIGFGANYNKNWPAIQVVELDSNKNDGISQDFWFNTKLKWVLEGTAE